MIQLIPAARIRQIYTCYTNSGDTLNASILKERIRKQSIIPIDDNGNPMRLSL